MNLNMNALKYPYNLLFSSQIITLLSLSLHYLLQSLDNKLETQCPGHFFIARLQKSAPVSSLFARLLPVFLSRNCSPENAFAEEAFTYST